MTSYRCRPLESYARSFYARTSPFMAEAPTPGSLHARWAGRAPGSRRTTVPALLPVLLLVLALVGPALLRPAPAAAQMPTVTGEWRQLEEVWTRWHRDLSQSERATIGERTRTILEVLRSAPGADPPAGLDVEPKAELLDWFNPGHTPEAHPARSTILLLLYPYRAPCADCAPEAARWSNGLHVEVNSPEAALWNWRDAAFDFEDEPRYYPEPRRTGTVAGFPLYEDQILVLSAREEPLWVPVTHRRYLEAQLRVARRSLAEVESMAAGPTSYEQQVHGEDAMDWDQLEAQLRAILPAAEAEARIEEMRAQRAEVEKALREHQGEELEARSEMVQQATEYLETVENALRGLTPERAATPVPAHCNRFTEDGFLCADGAEGRLVMLNPDYFDRGLPVTAAQLVVVRPAKGRAVDVPVVDRLMETFFHRTDWRRVADLLR